MFEALFEGGIRPSDTDKADMEGIVILEKRSSGAESSKATAVQRACKQRRKRAF